MATVAFKFMFWSAETLLRLCARFNMLQRFPENYNRLYKSGIVSGFVDIWFWYDWLTDCVCVVVQMRNVTCKYMINQFNQSEYTIVKLLGTFAFD